MLITPSSPLTSLSTSQLRAVCLHSTWTPDAGTVLRIDGRRYTVSYATDHTARLDRCAGERDEPAIARIMEAIRNLFLPSHEVQCTRLLNRDTRATRPWRKVEASDVQYLVDLFPSSSLAPRQLRLSGIDLQGADLRGADLRFWNFEGASLKNVDFRGADCRNACFNGADLRGAIFGYDTDIRGASFRHARLAQADLRHVSFQDVDFRGADFSAANLSDKNLSNADLRGARFVRANLADARLREIDLNAVDFSHADLRNVSFFKRNLEGLKLQGATLTGASFGYADFRHVDLNGVNFHGAEIDRANFQDADLTGCKLQGASLEGGRRGRDLTNFRGANLSGQDLTHMDLRKTDFSHANLANATLDGARLAGSSFHGANLSGVKLHGLDFTDCQLKDVQVDDTCRTLIDTARTRQAVRENQARILQRRFNSRVTRGLARASDGLRALALALGARPISDESEVNADDIVLIAPAQFGHKRTDWNRHGSILEVTGRGTRFRSPNAPPPSWEETMRNPSGKPEALFFGTALEVGFMEQIVEHPKLKIHAHSPARVLDDNFNERTRHTIFAARTDIAYPVSKLRHMISKDAVFLLPKSIGFDELNDAFRQAAESNVAKGLPYSRHNNCNNAIHDTLAILYRKRKRSAPAPARPIR